MEVPGGHSNKCQVLFYEFLGTGMLLTAINWTQHSEYAYLGIGLTLYVNIIIFGSISGGHFNPAVTAAVLIKESSLNPSKAAANVSYACMIVIAQVSGAIFFTLIQLSGISINEWGVSGVARTVPPIAKLCPGLVGEFKNNNLIINPFDACDATGYYAEVFIGEIIGTFIFISLILCVKYHNTANDDLVNGFGVSFALIAMIKVIGRITGGCLNPAVAIAQSFVQSIVFLNPDGLTYISHKSSFYFFLGPLIGGILAGLFAQFRKYALDCLEKSSAQIEYVAEAEKIDE